MHTAAFTPTTRHCAPKPLPALTLRGVAVAALVALLALGTPALGTVALPTQSPAVAPQPLAPPESPDSESPLNISPDTTSSLDATPTYDDDTSAFGDLPTGGAWTWGSQLNPGPAGHPPQAAAPGGAPAAPASQANVADGSSSNTSDIDTSGSEPRALRGRGMGAVRPAVMPVAHGREAWAVVNRQVVNGVAFGACVTLAWGCQPEHCTHPMGWSSARWC
jgi:hypothetical protein